jgi:non-ribosomal peptide synthetase component F
VITGDILGERARLSPNAVALIHVPTRQQFTYAELNRRALQCARLWTIYRQSTPPLSEAR